MGFYYRDNRYTNKRLPEFYKSRSPGDTLLVTGKLGLWVCFNEENQSDPCRRLSLDKKNI